MIWLASGSLARCRYLTVAKVEGPKTFRVTGDPGSRGFLHCSGTGKTLVAFTPDGPLHVEQGWCSALSGSPRRGEVSAG